MVEAEWLAFHIVTILAGRFGSEYLAAQSALVTLMTISFQIPFPLSVAASTRVANLIGADAADTAKLAAKFTFIMAGVFGHLDLAIYTTLRSYLPLLFTRDRDVIDLVSRMSPLVAVMQFFDSISTGAHGLLRGLGKQSIGGIASLFSYYAISLPISFYLAFALDLKLAGMWTGLTIGLFV
ncbi:hypothetical protein CDD83_7207 [Cordyceps sp. RAO-2017]|nr:hypothetical protein CDD83_7207 [Cordyceps sp. RAO-2017]